MQILFNACTPTETEAHNYSDLCLAQQTEAHNHTGMDCTEDAKVATGVIAIARASLGRKNIAQYIRGHKNEKLRVWIERNATHALVGDCPL